MSRLYSKVTVDETDKTYTKRGNQVVMSNIYWGSREDSKLAASVVVRWNKGSTVPTVHFVYGEDVLVGNVVKEVA